RALRDRYLRHTLHLGQNARQPRCAEAAQGNHERRRKDRSAAEQARRVDQRSRYGLSWAEHPMRAIAYREYGGPDVLLVHQRPVPRPTSSQVLIRVAAAGVNPVDYRMRQGELRWLLPGGF